MPLSLCSGVPGEGESRAASTALLIANLAGLVIERIAMAVAVLALSAMFCALLAEVIVRYFTDRSLGWPTELPNILFPWLIMSGIVIAAQRGAHIAAEPVRMLLGDGAVRALLMGLHLLVAVSFTYLGWLSLTVIAITKIQVFPMTGLGQSWAYSSMLFGFGGIALASIINMVRVLLVADPRGVQHTDPEHTT
ncbi:TRAP transporter small permease [Thioclava sp. BHET1]|nr:TRAP transporter small permease [Thioclava sp. BHET1]